MMRNKAKMALSTVSVLLMSAGSVSAASSPGSEGGAIFAPVAGSSTANAWISSNPPLVRLAQNRDVFPPAGFDPSLPDSQQKPERAPVWPISPTEAEPAKPLKIEPMKLLQAPEANLAPAPPKLPEASRFAAPASRPVYPAPQRAAPYGYGYPLPPGYNPAQAGRNPWAQGNRNSWTKAGRNSWSNTGANAWAKTGKNTVTDRNKNPWANPARAAQPPQKAWGGNPYYGQRQPVFAPRYGNPWQADAKTSTGGYIAGYPPLYRRGSSNTKSNPSPVYAPGVYPNYNFAPPAPWYGAAPGIR